MEENKTIVENPLDETQSPTEPQKTNCQKSTVSKIFAVLFYLAGVILICVAIYYLNNDLSPRYSFSGLYDFDEHEYVGGDAYNFIISASRATGILVKSLIYTVLGCTSLVLGRLCH